MIGQVRLISIAILVFICFLDMAQASTGLSFVEQFFEANQAYKNHQFQQAVDGYRHLIKNGYENGPVHYNLGNAYFRRGDLGRAILSYERACLLIPRDNDLAFNLSHARNQTQDAYSDLQMSSLSDFLGLGGLNRYEVFFGFVLLNFLFFSLLCIRLYKKTEWTYYLSIFLAIVIGIGGCALALKWVAWASDSRAVILSEEVVVRPVRIIEIRFCLNFMPGRWCVLNARRTIGRCCSCQKTKEVGWNLINWSALSKEKCVYDGYFLSVSCVFSCSSCSLAIAAAAATCCSL